jgi:3-hydroxyacyl-CoA dehydrogenase/enoyl-CoA hydratase/3-hydroxybutyryl-CoA epimerase
VIVDDPKAVVGFPEVSSACCRAPVASSARADDRHRAGADGLLLQGQRLRPRRRKEMGLVDEIVATREDLIPAAKAWIKETRRHSSRGMRTRSTRSPAAPRRPRRSRQNLPAFPANLRKQLKGANYPAPVTSWPRRSRARRSTSTRAIEIETRYFVDLATGQVAKNMIQAFFFDLNRVNGDRGRPTTSSRTPRRRSSCSAPA